mgnify:CR=1 FL=1
MKLVLASKNAKKLAEMNAILSELGVEVCSEAQAGVDVDVEETGTTFEENSLLKAKAVMEASGLPAALRAVRPAHHRRRLRPVRGGTERGAGGILRPLWRPGAG